MPNMSDDIHDKERELNLNNEKFKTSEYVSDSNKETVSKFCDKCFAQGLSNARVSKYISNFHTIFKLAPDSFELETAEEEDLEVVVARIEKSDYSEATKSDFKTALKKYYKVMEGDPKRDEYPDKVGFINTHRDKRKIQEPDPLDKEAIEKIIDECKNDRDLMLIKTTLYHGLRNSEAVKLQRKHIDLEKNQIKIMDGKGNKDRIVPTPSELQNDLEFYTKDMSYNDYLFPSKRRNKHLSPRAFEMKIRKYALKSDLYPQGITADNLTQEIPYAERIVPHSLRHTYATRLLRAGEPMAKVSRLLGHESVKTTVDIYGHLNIEDLRETAEKVSING